MARNDGSADVPVPGTPRYERAVFVIFSGHYDHLTGRQARDLIDSDEPLLPGSTGPSRDDGSGEMFADHMATITRLETALRNATGYEMPLPDNDDSVDIYAHVASVASDLAEALTDLHDAALAQCTAMENRLDDAWEASLDA